MIAVGDACLASVERGIGVRKIKIGVLRHAFQQLAGARPAQLVPSHVREAISRRKCRNLLGKQRESRVSWGFIARGEPIAWSPRQIPRRGVPRETASRNGFTSERSPRERINAPKWPTPGRTNASQSTSASGVDARRDSTPSRVSARSTEGRLPAPYSTSAIFIGALLCLAARASIADRAWPQSAARGRTL